MAKGVKLGPRYGGLYAYYKQATEVRKEGSVLANVIEYDSWSSLSGMAMHDAMVAYVELVDNLTLQSEAISCALEGLGVL